MVELELMDRVQFIYELALAQLELKGLGADFEVTNSLRKFILKKGDEDLLVRRLAYFKRINGKTTIYERLVQYNQTKSINQYLTHWIYPYKGKFHPQMIRALLNFIGLKEGDVVLDPFVGSGTTAVEAQVMGINCIGVDISPLCILQSKVKTESIFVLDEIEKIKNEVIKTNNSNFGLGDFNTKVLTLQRFIENITNEKVKNFFKIAEMIAHSDMSRRKKNFTQSFSINVEKMLASVKDFKKAINELNLKLGKIDIKRGDARKLDLEDESVDGIITSPPYSIALDYVKNDSHALKALGYDTTKIREEFIGVRGTGVKKIDLYNEDMMKSVNEMFRVLKPGKYCVIVLGDATYQGKKVETVDFVIKYAEKTGFKLIKNIDKIIFGLYNVMKKENILIFKKPEVGK